MYTNVCVHLYVPKVNNVDIVVHKAILFVLETGLNLFFDLAP